MRKIIVSILVIGLLMNTVPAIMGREEAADKPKETTDELAFDAEALVNLIDIDELDSRMENDAYADDDIIMVINVEPSLQESIGVEQLTIKKNGQGTVKLVHPVPKYVSLNIGKRSQTAYFIFILKNGVKLTVYNICFFNPTTGNLIVSIPQITKVFIGFGQLFSILRLTEVIRDRGLGWGYVKVTARLQWISGTAIADLWAEVKCYNDGNTLTDGDTIYLN